jgi:hypothetical protein
MDQIFGTLNKLIIDTSGGVLVVWSAGVVFFVKFLKYCGSKIAEGANGDLIKKLMPDVQKFITDIVGALESKLDSKLEKIENRMDMYDSQRAEKHNAKGKYDSLIDALKSGDQEIINIHLQSNKDTK